MPRFTRPQPHPLVGLALLGLPLLASAVDITGDVNFSNITGLSDSDTVLNFTGDHTVTIDATETNEGFAFSDLTAILSNTDDEGKLLFNTAVTFNGSAIGEPAVTGNELNTFEVGPGVTLTLNNVAGTVTDPLVNLNGNVTTGAGSSLVFFAQDNDELSSIVTNGEANLDADTSLSINVQGYITPAVSLPLIDADAGAPPTVTGGIASTSAVVSFTKDEDAGALAINAIPSRVTYQSLVSDPRHTIIATTLQTELAAAGFDPSGLDRRFFGILDSATPANFTSVVESLGPDYTGGVSQTAFHHNDIVTQTLFTHLDHTREQITRGLAAGEHWHGFGFWLRGYAGSLSQSERNNVAGFDANSQGISLGLDSEWGPNSRVGFAISLGQSDVDSHLAHRAQTDVEHYQAALYGYWACQNYFFNWIGGYALNDYEGQRQLQNSTLVANSHYHGNQVFVSVNPGLVYAIDNADLTVEAIGTYGYLDIDAYREQGANAANLSVNSQSYHVLKGALGLRLGLPLPNSARLVLPEVFGRLQYDLDDEPVEVSAKFGTTDGQLFAIQGAPKTQFSWATGASLLVAGYDGFSLQLRYQYTSGSDFDAHAGLLTFRYDYSDPEFYRA